MITVNSWDELLEVSQGFITENIDPKLIDFHEDFVFKVKLSGKSWDGYIDYRGANYLLNLQSSVRTILSELSPQDIPLRGINKHITVKLRVEEGCSLFEINMGEAFKGLFSMLTGGQLTFVLVYAMSCITGVYTALKLTTKKYEFEAMQKEKEIELKAQADRKEIENTVIEQQQKAFQTMAELAGRALDIVEKKDLEKPNRVLINNLEPEDIITFNDNIPVTAAEAKKIYPKKPKSQTNSSYFDDDYQILNIDFDKIPQVFTLQKYGFRIRAIAELAGKDTEQLGLDLNAAIKNGEKFIAPLQIFIVYTENGIQAASITNIGGKRDGSKNISELIDIIEK